MQPEVQQLYEIIYEQVEGLGAIRDTDKLIIERLAFDMYTVRQCEQQLLKEGFTVMGAHKPMEHPAVAIKTKSQNKIREAYILLGLDFASQLKKDTQEQNAGPSEFMQALLGGKL